MDAASDGTAGITRFTAQQRASGLRELDRLLDALAQELATISASAPGLGLKLYRSPGRCVMQGSVGALSVSWFPSAFEEAAIGDLQVIEWRGIVSLPGGAPTAGRHATIVEAGILHLVWTAASEWAWQQDDDQSPHSSTKLARRWADQLRRLSTSSEGLIPPA
ncbi:MAG TPA: hypothetical protein VFW98_09430 [Gemmatimonadaceae bacterium]|nr:hypothetical protein [Gemmatimonadaceae bacterium]